LRATAGWPIADFVAVGLGLTVVPDEDLATLHDVPAKVGGVKAAVGAGTGLGEVFLVDSAAPGAPAPVYVAHPCEGGMTEFLAHDEEEWKLREWLRREKKCGPREDMHTHTHTRTHTHTHALSLSLSLSLSQFYR
jgi:glucokinase